MHEHVFIISPEMKDNVPEDWGSDDERARRRRPAAQRAQGGRHRCDPRPDRPRPRPLHPAHRRAGRPHRPADHRRHRPVHVQRAAPLLAGADPGQRARTAATRWSTCSSRTSPRASPARAIKAGVIKCATDRPGITPDVERVLRACAQTHRAHRVSDHHAHVRRRSPRPGAAGDLQGGGCRPDPRRHRPQRRHRRPRLPRGADRQRLDPRHGPLRHRRLPARRTSGSRSSPSCASAATPTAWC